MKTIHYIKLTKPEINHLLGLIDLNEADGSYVAPKQQYWARHERIKTKLLKMLRGIHNNTR